MLLKTAALSVFIASVALAQPAPRSERDYWAETQLGFDATLNGEISDQTCYQQQRVFRGCLAGLHAGLSVLRSYSAKGVLPGERGVLPGFIGSDADATDYRALAIAAWARVSPPQRRPSFTAALAALKNLVPAGDLPWATARALNGYLGIAIDPHTAIMPMAVRDQLEQAARVNGRFGITFALPEVEGRPMLIISQIDPAAPSREQLRVGDVFISINGVAGNAIELLQAMSSLQNMRVVVENADGRREVDMRRGPITDSNVEASLLEHAGLKTALIKLASYMPANTCQDIGQKIQAQLRAGARSLVLDLRNNGGGRVDQAMCLISMFLEEGAFLWRDFNIHQGHGTQVRRPRGPRILQDIPTVVLVNGSSASASEVTATYLQAYGKGIVVGENTFGKGSMQMNGAYPRNQRVVMSLTTGLYYGPNGVSPQLIGVTPDVEVFPLLGQTAPTEFKRERDLYPDAIPNEVNAPRDPAREARNQRLTDCLARDAGEEVLTAGLNAYEARVLDLQLATAKAILKCHKTEGMAWPRGIEIPSVPMPGPMRDMR